MYSKLQRDQLYFHTFVFMIIFAFALFTFNMDIRLFHDSNKKILRFEPFLENLNEGNTTEDITENEILECKKIYNKDFDIYFDQIESKLLDSDKLLIEKYLETVKIAIRHGLIRKIQILRIKDFIQPGNSQFIHLKNRDKLREFTVKLRKHLDTIKNRKKRNTREILTVRGYEFQQYGYFDDFSAMPMFYTSIPIKMPELFNFGSIALLTIPIIANIFFVIKKFIFVRYD